MRNKSKKFLFTFLGFGILVLGGMSYLSFSVTQQLSTLNQIKDGLSVCFARVTGTYRAQLNQASSSYYGPSYIQMTEECFAEVKEGAMAEWQGKGLVENAKLNHLMTDVYWLHQWKPEEFLSKSTEAEQRFDRIEETRLLLENAIAEKTRQIAATHRYVKLTFSFLLLLTVGLFCFDWLERRKNRLQNEKYDLAAAALRAEGDRAQHIAQASKLLQAALEYNELPECSKLCQDVLEIKGQPQAESTLALTAVEFEDKNSSVQSFNLEQLVETVLNASQQKLSVAQVFTEIRGSRDLQVHGDKAVVEQCLYYILQSCFQRFSQRPCSHPFLLVAFEAQGTNAEMILVDNARPLSQEDQNLVLAKTHAAEFDLAVAWNCSVDDGNHVTFTIPLAERSVEIVPTRKTIAVTKTTKREWMEKNRSLSC